MRRFSASRRALALSHADCRLSGKGFMGDFLFVRLVDLIDHNTLRRGSRRATVATNRRRYPRIALAQAVPGLLANPQLFASSN
jgi:hypothetical protein